MRGHYGTGQRRKRLCGNPLHHGHHACACAVVVSRNVGDTINREAASTARTVRGKLPSDAKKLPTRRTPRREVGESNNYRNNEEIQLRTSSNVRQITTRTDSLIQFFFIKQHLLSMNPASNHQRLLAGFVFVSENMPPRKEVSPVYMEAR